MTRSIALILHHVTLFDGIVLRNKSNVWFEGIVLYIPIQDEGQIFTDMITLAFLQPEDFAKISQGNSFIQTKVMDVLIG